MNSTTPALIAAAAGVALGHAIMPDHWVPLAVVGRTRRYPLAHVARLSGLAGIAHVLVSLLLGGLIVVIGLQLRSSIEQAQNTVVGAVLIATGLGFIAFELSGRGHTHSHHAEHGHEAARPPASHRHRLGADQTRDQKPAGRGLRAIGSVMVPFGAAASPDLTILPVFLAATAIGAPTAVGSLLAFSVVTVSTMVGLTLLATAGGYQLRGKWLERWGNAVTAATLLIIGALVLTGVI